MNIAYPFQVNSSQRTAVADSEAYIRQLIEQLLFTNPGERVNRPSFGGGLQQLIFSPSNEELVAAHEFLITSTLQQWLGDFITVEALQTSAEEETLIISIQYINKTNQKRQIERFIMPQA